MRPVFCPVGIRKPRRDRRRDFWASSPLLCQGGEHYCESYRLTPDFGLCSKGECSERAYALAASLLRGNVLRHRFQLILGPAGERMNFTIVVPHKVELAG